MKQYITVEQLLQVDFSKLAHATKKDETIYDELCHYVYATDEEKREQQLILKISRLLTIGKMIEILDLQCEINIYSLGSTFHVETLKKEYVEHELCDALWQAVKETI